jgi:membrane-bound metal-dependent hydrolase YbcI (DUF457 family)
MWGLGRPELVACSALVGGGAGLLPDLDEEHSTVSRAGGVATVVVSRATRTLAGGHRRATHSLVGIAVCCSGLWPVVAQVRDAAPVVAGLLAALAARVACFVVHLGRTERWAAEAAVGSWVGPPLAGGASGGVVVAILAAGMASHMLADDLTDSGTPVLWPTRRRLALHLFHTGGRAEALVQWGLFAALGVAAYAALAPHAALLRHEVGRTLRPIEAAARAGGEQVVHAVRALEDGLVRPQGS